jgi:protein-tyrosine phosphatase
MIDDSTSVDFIKETIPYIGNINKYIDKKKNVFIHCYKGLSRSVCFTLLILINRGMSFKNAYKLIEDKKHMDPNPVFIQQIIEYVNKY